MLRRPRSRALRDKKILHGSQRGVRYFVLKGKTDDRIKQVPAGNYLLNRLFDVPTERQTELGLSEQIFRVEGASADRISPVQFVANWLLLSSVIVKNRHVRDVLESETRKVSTE